MCIEELIFGVCVILVLKIYGEDLGELDWFSVCMKDVLVGVFGVVDLVLEVNIGKLQICIKVDCDVLVCYGFNVDDVLIVVKNGIGGEFVIMQLDGVKCFDIIVCLDDVDKVFLLVIECILICIVSGVLVQLLQVVEVSDVEGYLFICCEQL